MELGLGEYIYEGVRKRMEKEKRSHRETGGSGKLINLAETGRPERETPPEGTEVRDTLVVYL